MRGVVVAPQPPAAEVGADVLRAGGNAFDAAVAAGFMQMAIDPLMCGIGGMGIAQVYHAATGEHVIVDFNARAGSRMTADVWADRIREAPGEKYYAADHVNVIGYQAILIPGTVAGFGTIRSRWGSLPWKELLRPAIQRLRDGYPLYAYITDYLDERYQYPSGESVPNVEQFLKTTEPMADLWLRDDGTPRRVGDELKNDAYAETLERLADEGPASFYRGSTAADIAEDFAVHDALVTADDLSGYQARIRPPLLSTYRGHTVATNPAPGGGPTLLQILHILEGFDIQALDHNSADHLHILISAMRLAFADRKDYLGDPDFVDVPIERLLSKAYAAEQVERIHRGEVASTVVSEAPGTTHVTVADQSGNVASVTHTLGHGSGVITPGLGFQYNSGAGFDVRPDRLNSMAPGKARLGGMTPTIVFQDRVPTLALGSPGSNAIITGVAQVIVNVVDFAMTPSEAVSAPRVHCEGDEVRLETRVPEAIAKALRERSHRITYRPFAYDTLQGRVQLVMRTDAGDWQGASDPRRQGGVAAYA